MATPPLIVPAGGIIAPRGPLVRIARVKWERNSSISDMIDYFDEPRFHDKKIKSDADRFALLNVKEINAIADIIRKCRADFSYAARNFFWITTKRKGEILFKMLESQELIYEHLLGLKARGLLMKLMILKARQLGSSTLVEGLIAWNTMFFKNVNAIVVSYDPDHAAYLFGIMQYIMDRMPWWLKPQISSREYKDGLRFENPDPQDRRLNPGLNSAIMVQAANKRTGVGTGTRINCAHLSEYGLWDQNYARDVIEQDLGNALAEDDPNMFAILESTARGAGNYSYRLWNKNMELGEQAEWHPLFLPWFFESTRVLAPPNGWRPEAPEIQMNDRVQIDWLRCDNQACDQYHERYLRTRDMELETCPTCGIGTLKAYSLTPDQMYWMQRKRKNAEKEGESLKKLQQEQASTAESAFTLSGIAVFGEGAQEFVNAMVRPPIKEGFLDKTGKFHGVNTRILRRNSSTNDFYEGCHMSGCDQDHSFGDENGEKPLHLWREPEKDAEYTIGADVAEGLGGDADYSVGFVLKINRKGGPDEQVAVFRSNMTDPVRFAQILNYLGRWYNNALMCIELNRFDTCGTWVRFQCQYPNLYRWKHLDSTNPNTNKWGWLTTVSTKPRLYISLKRWLQAKLILVYSRNLASELKTFTKVEYNERAAGSEDGAFDDEAMACLPAGTMVTTITGQKAIETIRTGDRVLTHKGRFMPVLRTMQKSETDRLIKVNAVGRPPLLLTSDHKLYLWEKYKQYRNNGKQVCWNKYRNPDWISFDQAGDDITNYGTCSVVPTDVIDYDTLDIASYIPGDCELYGNDSGIGFRKVGEKRGGLARMVAVKRFIPIDRDLLRMLGYYLAEGGYGPHAVSFASHTREEPIRNWLVGYLSSLGVNPGVNKVKADDNGYVVWCSSMVIRSFFYQFGCKTDKKLPGWTTLLAVEKQREILIGYLLGDGSFHRQAGGIQANTISEQAAFQLFNMSMRCGWPVSIASQPGQNGHNMQWKLSYSSHVALEIKKHIDPELLACKRPFDRVRASKNDKVRLTDGYLIGKVKSVSEVSFCGPVYDIEVAEDHSFVANGTVVSNCMIALYCSHETDWDDSVNQMNITRPLTLEEAPWIMHCKACDLIWPAHNSRDGQCGRCGSRVIEGRPNSSRIGGESQANAFADGDIPRDQAQEWAVSLEAPETPQPEYDTL